MWFCRLTGQLCVLFQVHGQKAVWEDPVEWVRGTLPWPSAQQDQARLVHLPPPSMTSASPGRPSEAKPLKDPPPCSTDTDPLVRSCPGIGGINQSI